MKSASQFTGSDLITMTSTLERVGEFVRGLKGWRRLAFAVAAGGVSALGFEPIRLFPLLLLGYAVLVLLIDGAQSDRRPVRATALAGWSFSFGQFLAGLHWVGFAFMVDPSAHEWQIPFVAVLFPGWLAVYIAVGCAAAGYFWRAGAARIFLFTLCYGLAEWVRGHALTGFPWNVAAYGWGASPAVLQSAALFGSWTLTLLTILFGASLALLFEPRPKWILPSLMTALFAIFWLGGTVRLATVHPPLVKGVNVRLVQPNIPQAEKYSLEYVARNWLRLVSLSRAPGSPSVMVWPEAAPPFLLDRAPVALRQIAELTQGKQGLITGAIRRRYELAGRHYSNSLYLFGRNGVLVGTYDKFHLVPFGEYLPFEETLGALGLTKVTGIEGSFTPGDGPHSFDLPGAGTVAPLICYEILFPEEVMPPKRPDWFVNVTDDSWFGPWAGPRQHLLVARVRAIEEGVPVARAANTGISAMIDPLGRVTASLGLGTTGILDAALPAPIASTPYGRLGEWWFWLGACTLAALTWRFSRGR
jgi:apolipoprotein N-acyltransferase